MASLVESTAQHTERGHAAPPHSTGLYCNNAEDVARANTTGSSVHVEGPRKAEAPVMRTKEDVNGVVPAAAQRHTLITACFVQESRPTKNRNSSNTTTQAATHQENSSKSKWNATPIGTRNACPCTARLYLTVQSILQALACIAELGGCANHTTSNGHGLQYLSTGWFASGMSGPAGIKCKRRARRVRAIRKTGYAAPDVRFPAEGVDDEPGVPADRHRRRVLDHKVQSCMHAHAAGNRLLLPVKKARYHQTARLTGGSWCSGGASTSPSPSGSWR